jgi:hypothetical protein
VRDVDEEGERMRWQFEIEFEGNELDAEDMFKLIHTIPGVRSVGYHEKERKK